MERTYSYQLEVEWTGNKGSGTKTYAGYERSHQIKVDGKPVIEGSADPTFRGDVTKHNPEELFLSSISSRHMLWNLHLCAEAGVIVQHDVDKAEGIMQETSNGGGEFVNVTLKPQVQVKEQTMIEQAKHLHKKANELCFIANSLTFSVIHEPEVFVLD